MKKIQILMAFGGLLLGSHAYAGAESHGGQVVVCPGKETVMLDYYQATLPTADGGVPVLADISKMNSQDVIKFLSARIDPNGQLASQLSRAVELIGPVGTWLQGSLQAISDSDPAYTLPPNCSLQQVAIRQDTTMYVDPSVLQLLSPAQQGILFMHEALYYVASQVNNLDSSVEVRMVIRNLMAQTLDEVALSKSIHEMGSKNFWWEDFASKTYVSADENHPVNLQLSYDPLLNGDSFTFLLWFPSGSTGTAYSKGVATCDPESPFFDSNHCEIKNIGGGLDCQMNYFNSDPTGTEVVEFELDCKSRVVDPNFSDFKACLVLTGTSSSVVNCPRP